MLDGEIEVHDSTVQRITDVSGSVSIDLSAYIHKSDGRLGIDRGTGWVQEARLTFGRSRLNLRRGRQSFVMALGFTGAAHLAPRVARFLADPDVDGQVIDTLLKMRAPGFVAAVRPLLTDTHAWIRNLAKKYVARYSPAA